MQQMLTSSVMDQYLEPFTGDVRKYVDGLIKDTRGEFDTAKGINLDLYKNEFRIGNKKVDFEGNNFVIFAGKNKIEYGLTPGLLELLFIAHPNKKLIEAGDKKMYKDALSYNFCS